MLSGIFLSPAFSIKCLDEGMLRLDELHTVIVSCLYGVQNGLKPQYDHLRRVVT
jgi:hypothetical protein